MTARPYAGESQKSSAAMLRTSPQSRTSARSVATERIARIARDACSRATKYSLCSSSPSADGGHSARKCGSRSFQAPGSPCGVQLAGSIPGTMWSGADASEPRKKLRVGGATGTRRFTHACWTPLASQRVKSDTELAQLISASNEASTLAHGSPVYRSWRMR